MRGGQWALEITGEGDKSGWIWDAFAVEPGRTCQGLGREVRHEATERERDEAHGMGICSDWDPGWTLEIRSVSCSASLAWPEMRVDVEWGDGRTWSQPSAKGAKSILKKKVSFYLTLGRSSGSSPHKMQLEELTFLYQLLPPMNSKSTLKGSWLEFVCCSVVKSCLSL